MAKQYKKLSFFGKSVWTGLLFSMIMARSGVYPFDGLGLVLLAVCFVLAFSNKVYCRYNYQSPKELDWTQKIFSITGRMSRLPYLCYVLLSIFSTIIMFSYNQIGERELFFLFIGLPISIITIGAATRRSQDCGYNSWVPFIPFALIVLLFIPGEKKDNQYGPTITK